MWMLLGVLGLLVFLSGVVATIIFAIKKQWVIVRNVGLAAVAGFILFMVGALNDSTETAKLPIEEENNFSYYTLGMTPEEFMGRFNQYSDEVGTDLKIIGTTLKDDTEHLQYFKYDFADNLYITANVNKADGTIQKIMMVGWMDEKNNLVDLMLGLGLMIGTFNNEINLDVESRGELLSELMINNDDGVIDNEVVKNGLRYKLEVKPGEMKLIISDSNEI